MAKAQNGSGDSGPKLDWSAALEEPVQPVNVFSAQANPSCHVLNLGFYVPQIKDDVRRARRAAPVRVAARILLTPGDMGRLVEVLSASIESREELAKKNEQEQ